MPDKLEQKGYQIRIKRYADGPWVQAPEAPWRTSYFQIYGNVPKFLRYKKSKVDPWNWTLQLLLCYGHYKIANRVR